MKHPHWHGKCVLDKSGKRRKMSCRDPNSPAAFPQEAKMNPTSTAVELISCKKPGSFWRKVLFSQRIA